MTMPRQASLFGDQSADRRDGGPVECLGVTFASDEERRVHFRAILAQKLKDPAFRQIEGFPIGSDEDILRLSDPPHYTACPNPFLTDFIRHYGKPYDPARDNYQCEPFAVDVSEGKRDPLYEHYSYHTKVPHRAVARYIRHYTSPGDVVLDGFSGSGMTGLAAKWLATEDASERHAILVNLSTYATFIGHNYNHRPIDAGVFKSFEETSHELSWMYQTHHINGSICPINYTVWSDLFLCPQCGVEICFFDTFVFTTVQNIGATP